MHTTALYYDKQTILPSPQSNPPMRLSFYHQVYDENLLDDIRPRDLLPWEPDNNYISSGAMILCHPGRHIDGVAARNGIWPWPVGAWGTPPRPVTDGPQSDGHRLVISAVISAVIPRTSPFDSLPIHHEICLEIAAPTVMQPTALLLFVYTEIVFIQIRTPITHKA